MYILHVVTSFNCITCRCVVCTLRDVCMWNTGTQISDVILDIETAGVHIVKGFATIDDVALINVEVRPIIEEV